MFKYREIEERNVLIDEIQNKFSLISFSPFGNDKFDVMSVDNSTPAFKDFDKLEFSELLSLDLMLPFVNVKNGSDVFFSFWIVDYFLVSVDLAKGSSNQVINESLSFNVDLLQNFLIVNDSFDDLELFPFY